MKDLAPYLSSIPGLAAAAWAMVKARRVARKSVDQEAWDRASEFTSELVEGMREELRATRTRLATAERGLRQAIFRLDSLIRLLRQNDINVPPYLESRPWETSTENGNGGT